MYNAITANDEASSYLVRFGWLNDHLYTARVIVVEGPTPEAGKRLEGEQIRGWLQESGYSVNELYLVEG